jgi:hypothetical protein
MTETAKDRERAAWDELNAQEDYVRSMRHLSDDELSAQLVETLRKEKARIGAWLDSGDCSSSPGQAFISRPAGMPVGRDAAWAPPGRSGTCPELARRRCLNGASTRVNIESLPSYRICPLCAPT